MRKLILVIVLILSVVYVGLCSLLYFNQESILFVPAKLKSSYVFEFREPFEEIDIPVKDASLNGLLFKADSAKGLIFYLHGNGGSLAGWGQIAGTYTRLGYDIFMLDYRGYGKSSGTIESQQHIYDDNQAVYNEIKKRYNEDSIIILGYSIGSGLAAKLASDNHPKLLILQAPYYNLAHLMKSKYPFVPTFLLKYRFSTNEHLQASKVPVVIFHGDQDFVIPLESSLMLQKNFKTNDTLIILKGQGHNNISDNYKYQFELENILKTQ